MKIRKIAEVRPGQVRKLMSDFAVARAEGWYDLFCCHGSERGKGICIKYCAGPTVGHLGITHRIEGELLVEIPRTAEFQVDDVCDMDGSLVVLLEKMPKIMGLTDAWFCFWEGIGKDSGTLEKDLKRLGTLGVEYEIVPDALAEEVP